MLLPFEHLLLRVGDVGAVGGPGVGSWADGGSVDAEVLGGFGEVERHVRMEGSA